MFNGGGAHGAGEVASGPASGLPVPRYVSLKSDRVNVRAGPTKDHDVAWVFTRAGLPVEITAEFENWRRIRDWEGSEGWVYHSLLSGRRTAVVTLKAKDELVPLSDRPDQAARSPPGCNRVCSARSSAVPEAGAGLPARASTAGLPRNGCGASIRTRSSTDRTSKKAGSWAGLLSRLIRAHHIRTR